MPPRALLTKTVSAVVIVARSVSRPVLCCVLLACGCGSRQPAVDTRVEEAAIRERMRPG